MFINGFFNTNYLNSTIYNIPLFLNYIYVIYISLKILCNPSNWVKDNKTKNRSLKDNKTK